MLSMFHARPHLALRRAIARQFIRNIEHFSSVSSIVPKNATHFLGVKSHLPLVVLLHPHFAPLKALHDVIHFDMPHPPPSSLIPRRNISPRDVSGEGSQAVGGTFLSFLSPLSEGSAPHMYWRLRGVKMGILGKIFLPRAVP
jgi:hypothetical protein